MESVPAAEAGLRRCCEKVANIGRSNVQNSSRPGGQPTANLLASTKSTRLAPVATTSAHNAAQLAAQQQRPAPGAQGAGPAVYDEKVRRKAERAVLPAWDCPTCSAFFAALEKEGRAAPVDAMNCPDCNPGGAAGAARAGESGAQGGTRTRVAELRQDASRHRCTNAAPATPKNFWGMGLADRVVP